ncbi:MAG: GAF domain-containing protein [Oscillatoriales cyanobacterium C42_A2020_001]|nr:GAF domain-containing protein [Leptolyngbyaceae cyanobacterium C42_A2020_001]
MPSTETAISAQQSLQQQELLHRITLRIRQSLELQTILETTVAEMRSFLGTDRVKVYRFHADGSGEVIAEAIDKERLPSLLKLNFPADDIPPYARELLLKARQRVVVDVVNQTTTGHSLEEDWETLEAGSDLRYRPVDPCHVEYLTAMGVKSSVVVPILQNDRLWGLMVSHHSEQRTVSVEELEFIQAVVDQVEVAIAQATLLSQLREQAERETKINRVSTLLHQIPTVRFEAALKIAVEIFEAVGGRLYLTATHPQEAEELYTYGEQPSELINSQQQVEHHLMWQRYLTQPKAAIGNVEANEDSGTEPWSHQRLASGYSPTGERPDLASWAICDIYQEPLLRTIAPSFQETSIRGVLIVPLRYSDRLLGCLTLFRAEIETERLWAGYRDHDSRQQMPQPSFAAWRELKRGSSAPWTEGEKQLAQEMADHFAMAVQQYRLYSQVRSLNTTLEHQVQERTTELHQHIEQQQTLSNVVAKVRSSLEIEEIFRFVTQEVCHFLKAERVAVYQFDENWGGKFVANFEFAETELVEVGQLGVNIVWNDTYLQETQGGRYQNNQIYVVNDVYTAGLTPCHLEILDQFKIKAFLTAPIFVGQTLWGVLAAYQHSQPHFWKERDIELMRQITDQLGVALQQAHLLAQTKQKTQQLAEMLEDLQQTQTQLIQTEKMSSLGQLVTGVAHEINNPVNFIYGNLKHIQGYTEELLGLLKLYQIHHPQVHADIAERMEEIDLAFLAEDLPKTLSSLQIGADRIRQIVLSLRNFSRIDEDGLKPANLHDGIDSTLMILHHRLKANGNFLGIEVVKEYGDIPLVECCAGQLNQVFMNILSNAIDALEDRNKARSLQELRENPSRISIRTELSKLNGSPCVRISIRDNGSGMTDSTLKRIFEPFFTTKPIGRGTGLGLSISHQIVTEKHQGTLHCDSSPEGTEFQIKLPLTQ